MTTLDKLSIVLDVLQIAAWIGAIVVLLKMRKGE